MNVKNCLVHAATAVAAAVAFAGCVSRPATFTASSVPMEQNNYSILSSEVSGTDTQVSICFISFGAPGSGQRNALAEALSQVPGANALVGMAVEHETFEVIPCLLPIFGIYKTRVTGTPVKAFDK